jgi:aryl-alcohol dehydrogenase-like predicted oxidoreductase
MQYIELTGTNLNVSELCIGSANFGTKVSRDDCKNQMDLFFERGGNFIDTAHMYNDWVPGELHRSEHIIGEWLKTRRGSRDKIILATKGAHPKLGLMDIGRLSKEEIVSDLNGSLEALNTDYIDLYFLHRDDIKRPVEEIVDTLEEQTKLGKIRWYGCSNWTVKRIREANEYAKKSCKTGFVCNQLMWSLADIKYENVGDKTMEAMDNTAYSFHKETGLSAMAYMSVAQGFFVRKKSGKPIPEGLKKWYECPQNDVIFETILSLSSQTGFSITDLSYFYLSVQPFPAVPISSFSSKEQLLDALEHCKAERPDLTAVKELNSLKKFKV